MTCGATPNIWPNPTHKSIGSSRSSTFQSKSVRLQMTTKFSDVERLFEEAFSIFVTDLKRLELGDAFEIDASKKFVATESNSDQYNDQGARRSRNCDLQTVNVNVMVSQSDVTFVHLDMDESYNLTIISKSNIF